MKRYLTAAVIFAALVIVPLSGIRAYASETLDPAQAEQIEFGTPAVTYPLGTPDGWPDWLGDEPNDPNVSAYEIEAETTVEDSDRLAAIEYHLSVISGGVILTICSAFIWFTILKPIKQFIAF